jgi:hypothetical protein
MTGACIVDLSFRPNLTTHMLVLLGQSGQLYLSIHEMKADRRRWIRSQSLQSGGQLSSWI